MTGREVGHVDRILVGVDRSPTARQSFAWAADLARRARCELIAARAFSPEQAELAPARDAELHDADLRDLDRWCARPAGRETTVRTVIVDGRARDALLQAASEHDVDLIVIGRGRLRHDGSLQLDGVARHVLHHSPVAVAILPQQGVGPIEHLVVGTDGSPHSLDVLDATSDLAGRLGVPVTVVHAYGSPTRPAADPLGAHRCAEAQVARWARRVEARVAVDIVVDGDRRPVAALVHAVAAHVGAAAVVGTPRLSPVTGLRAGHFSRELVARANSPIVVIPAGCRRSVVPEDV